MALTLSDLRQHVETDLTDGALQRLLDDATAEISSRFGDDAERTVRLEADGGLRLLRLMRPADTGETITVTEFNRHGVEIGTVDASGYRVVRGGRLLERIGCRWASTVEVTYTPLAEADLRDRVTVDLVKVTLTYEGMVKQDRVGDFTQATVADPKAYAAERERLLNQVGHRRGMRWA